MQKSRLYTKTGDQGTTSLVTGERVPKNCARLEAYGTIDELSSAIGRIAASPECPPQIRTELMQVQNMLFNTGGYLACGEDKAGTAAKWGLTPAHIGQIELLTDRLDAGTPPVHAFVLPGGTPAAADAHLARTVCRRAERRVLDLNAAEPVDPDVLRYLNRLSDCLFILARHLNHLSGVPETTWHKEEA